MVFHEYDVYLRDRERETDTQTHRDRDRINCTDGRELSNKKRWRIEYGEAQDCANPSESPIHRHDSASTEDNMMEGWRWAVAGRGGLGWAKQEIK